MTPQYVLALWIDVDPATRDERDRWYIHRHIADRARLPGWRRIRRFTATGATKPDTLAIYDVDKAEELVSEDYLSLQRQVSEEDKRMRATFGNVVRGTFRVKHHIGFGEGGMLASLRFHPDEPQVVDGTAQYWVTHELIPQLETLPGVVGVRLMISEPELRAQHDVHRKSGNEDAHAHWVLLVDVTEEEHLPSVMAALLVPGGVTRLCAEPVATGTYRLTYAISGKSAG